MLAITTRQFLPRSDHRFNKAVSGASNLPPPTADTGRDLGIGADPDLYEVAVEDRMLDATIRRSFTSRPQEEFFPSVGLT